ncbi:MAG: glycoside hydrolase family 75 protein [bacterium]
MKKLFLSLSLIFLFNSYQVSFAADTACDRTLLTSVGGKKIYKGNAAVFYQSGMGIDADGAPKAYHPTNDGDGRDYKANGYPWGIVRVKGKDYIQGQNDPAPGFYVSTTSLEDKSKKETDPARYVNSEEIPYIVLPPKVKTGGGINLGDLAMVMNKKNAQTSYAIFADVGPGDKIGEGSIALAKKLGINESPKKGGTSDDVVYIVFPNSGDRKPKSLEDINSKGEELFTKWGGIEKLNACFPTR